MQVFQRADILLPQTEEMKKWAVIACDQFTSDSAYWARVRQNVSDAPSTLYMILPEAELPAANETVIGEINDTMKAYLRRGIFKEYAGAYIYIERVLQDGTIRPGLLGMVDLEQYDYHPGSDSPIRATEKTVLERIPPREAVRADAPVELPHVLMLCDDGACGLIEPLREACHQLPKLYDFDLMEGGGHITGWLVTDDAADAFDCRFAQYSAAAEEKYRNLPGAGVLLAVGDGNHSLAAAKSSYETLKKQFPGEDLSAHPARYALVELENIHHPSLCFEPIHRIVTGVDRAKLMEDIAALRSPEGQSIRILTGAKTYELVVDTTGGTLAVAVLQDFLDNWLRENPGSIDYIHGEAELARLAEAEDAVGFLLPPMNKQDLFPGIVADGVLPRKTFSMGHACEKRYYLEGRRIK